MLEDKLYALRWMIRSAAFYGNKVLLKLRKVITGKQSTEYVEVENQYAPVIRAAKKHNITVNTLFPGFYELKNADKTFWYQFGYSIYDSAIGLKIAGNKYVTNKILSDIGMPVPRGKAFSIRQMKEAIEYFQESNFKRAVVKPARSTYGGKGVNTFVKNGKELKSAILDALMYDDYFQIEEFEEGRHFRVLIFRGELLSVAERVPARIKGDGVHAIKRIIKRENNRRILHDYDGPPLWPIDIDTEMKYCLREKGLSLSSIPKKDEVVYLKSICNYHKGGEAYEVYEQIHPQTVEACKRIMDYLKISLAGFDIITPDIGIPITDQGVFNEINTTPNLEGHYGVNNQEKARDVGGAIVKDIFELNS
jgi:cyanophycin synthetase